MEHGPCARMTRTNREVYQNMVLITSITKSRDPPSFLKLRNTVEDLGVYLKTYQGSYYTFRGVEFLKDLAEAKKGSTKRLIQSTFSNIRDCFLN